MNEATRSTDDTKLRLINAAGPLLAARGYDGISVREICHVAGANVAAINYHFGDKHSLYLACLQHAQSCEAPLLTSLDGAVGFSPQQRLYEFIRIMLASKLATDRPRWHLELMMREMVHPTEACAALVEVYIRPMANSLRAIVQELVPVDEDSNRGWMMGFSIVAQVLFYYENQPIIRQLIGSAEYARLSVDELAHFITHFTLAALGHAPPVTHSLPAESSFRPWQPTAVPGSVSPDLGGHA